MPTRKKATSTGKKAAAKKAAKSSVVSGVVPPYGEAIRGAVARGDIQEMKSLAASSRKWVSDVQAALKQLDSAVKKYEKK